MPSLFFHNLIISRYRALVSYLSPTFCPMSAYRPCRYLHRQVGFIRSILMITEALTDVTEFQRVLHDVYEDEEEKVKAIMRRWGMQFLDLCVKEASRSAAQKVANLKQKYGFSPFIYGFITN